MFYDDFFSELYKNKVKYLPPGGEKIDKIIKSEYN